ncbi:hypothetical protein [Phnomibacter sp. MR]
MSSKYKVIADDVPNSVTFTPLAQVFFDAGYLRQILYKYEKLT